MKRNVLSLSLLCVMALSIITGCSRENIRPDQVTDKSGTLNKEESEKIRSYMVDVLGYSAADIEDSDQYFIYQECIMFEKSTFWVDYGPYAALDPLAKHRKSSYKVNPTGSVYVMLSSNVPSSWKTQMRYAMTEWNNLNGRLKFYEYLYPYHDAGIGVITVKYQDLNADGTFARAGFPTSGGKIYNTIIINSGYTGTALTNSQKKKTSAHEIGHCLGLCHTNTTDGSALTTGYSSCDNYADNSSIMRQGRFDWPGFSTCDKRAYSKLYP